MDSKLRTNVETTSVNSPDFNYEDGLQPQKGSTPADVLDMSRMGKTQELQARLQLRHRRKSALTLSVEKFPIPVNRRLHHDPPILVGKHTAVSGASKECIATRWLTIWDSAASYGLTNGGTGGVIWMTLGVILGALCMVASIGEMASMAPTAGGQCKQPLRGLLCCQSLPSNVRELIATWVCMPERSDHSACMENSACSQFTDRIFI